MAATKVLSDTVFDAALAVIKSCTEANVITSADSILIDAITLDSANYTGPAAGSPTGRQITCLVSAASDMKAISVGTGGAAKKINLMLASVVHATAVLTSAVSLGASDQVNLGTFVVLLPDPT